MNRRGYCIYIHTVCEGRVPSVVENGQPCIFETELEAQREIVDLAMTRMQEFLDGHREYEDALTIEEYVQPVEILPDGTIRILNTAY